MRLTRLYLKNFRSYKEREFLFNSQVNVFYGANGQGKTNLLEAIYLLSTGKSFRTLHLKELVHEKEKFFYLEAQFLKEGIEQSIKLFFDGQNRKLVYNDTQYVSFTPLLGILPSVLYAPEDATLINGSPSDRRRFLDLHLAQIDPLYVYHLGRYFKALKHRNALLRQKMEKGIEPWEKEMSLAATFLSQKRASLIESLQPIAQKMIEILTNKIEKAKITYSPSLALGKSYEEAYKSYRLREIHAGCSLIGPHRDDFTVIVNDKEARVYASEGQKGTIVAGLKLAEWFHLKSYAGDQPLFGVDDFGIHLDPMRKQSLQNLLTEHMAQVFVTSPEKVEGKNFYHFEIER